MKLKHKLQMLFGITIIFSCINNSNKKENIKDTISKDAISKNQINNFDDSDSKKVTELKKNSLKNKKNEDLKVVINGNTYYKKNVKDSLFIMPTVCDAYAKEYKHKEKYSFIDTKKRKTYDITNGEYYEFMELGHPCITEEINSIASGRNLKPEEQPSYPDGIEKLQEFFIENYKLPFNSNVNGNIYVSFIIEKDGKLTDVKAIRDLGYGTGKEVIRVLKLCKKWNPAEKNGEKIRVLYTLIISLNNATIIVK